MINLPRRTPRTKKNYYPPRDELIAQGRRHRLRTIALDHATTRALRRVARNEASSPTTVATDIIKLVVTHCAYTGRCLYSVQELLETHLAKAPRIFEETGGADQLVTSELAGYLRALEEYHLPLGRVDTVFPDATLEHYQAALALIAQDRRPITLTDLAHEGCKLGRAYLRSKKKSSRKAGRA